MKPPQSTDFVALLIKKVGFCDSSRAWHSMTQKESLMIDEDRDAQRPVAHCCACCRADDEALLARERLRTALDYATAEPSPVINDETRAAAIRLLKQHFDAGVALKMPDLKFGA